MDKHVSDGQNPTKTLETIMVSMDKKWEKKKKKREREIERGRERRDLKLKLENFILQGL